MIGAEELAPAACPRREYLRRADEDYARAEDLYRSVAPFGSSAAMLRRIYDSRNSVASQIEVAKGERR